jgi:SAM-dependent methyltransferase
VLLDEAYPLRSGTVVKRMLTSVNSGLPAVDPDRPNRTSDHGLGVVLNQPWFMGELAAPTTFGHTVFSGTSAGSWLRLPYAGPVRHTHRMTTTVEGDAPAAPRVPPFVRLALPRLGVDPDHRLLEIGCGGGTAAAAVAARLATGHILAIDRSAAAVTRATRRNAEYIARGVAEIRHLDLTRLVVDDRSFDTIFALNVNLFLGSDVSVVDIIRRALRPRGRLVLGYWRRDPRQLVGRAERTSAALVAGGLPAPSVDWASSEHLFLTTTAAR